MIDRSDIQGRLRLFRYGLIVVVIVTFLISLLAPAVSLNVVTSAGLPAPAITDFLGNAILFTIVVGIIAVVAYSVYHYTLTKSWPFMGSSKTS
ncbi:MAG: hypothetical protein ABI690_26850 [Chloroflexota bacterium]